MESSDDETSDGGRRITATDQDGNDIGAEIEWLRAATRLDQIVPGRYSNLLLLNLFCGWKSGFVDPSKVTHEIELLEGREKGGFKPPVQNKHPPLKGLWHKHYPRQGLRSLCINLEHGLNKYGIPLLEQKAAGIKAASEARYLTAEIKRDINELIDDAIDGNRNRLKKQQQLTGEWILFAKHEGKNYYLDIATHDKSTHDHVRKNIEAICYSEFPFLRNILEEA